MPLRLKPHGFLRFHQLINIREGRVIVEDCGYCYSLSPDPDDEDQWLFRYEYLLTPPENVPHAHLHVNASKGEQQLQSIHFPTGRVSIEQVIAHLILEHHVEPKIENWFDVLFNSHQGFTQRRTDPQQSMFP